MSKVKYFYDLMSQPSRALWIALQMSKTPYEDCPVALRKFAQRSEEYKKINRFQKLPSIVDGDFHLGESVAILRYLADKGLFNEQLYPKDIQNRARVDEFLEWHHSTLRYGCAFYFLHVWLLPINGLADMPSKEEIAKLLKEMETNLKLVDKIWLKDTDFLTGNKMTVADLFGACEIEQTMEHRSEEYKKINRFQKVPYLVDGDFHLGESVAILRYLADKGQFSEQLYPKDLQNRARVDEFLEWQHLTLRYGCVSYFLNVWLYPMSGLGEVPSEQKMAKLQKDMEDNLKLVEKIWLNKSDFLTGNQLTAADLFGACEIEQTKLCKYDVSKKFPKTAEWLARVRAESNPFYDDGHKFIYKMAGISK